MMTSTVATIIQAVSPLFAVGAGAAAGAAAAGAAAAAAGAASGAGADTAGAAAAGAEAAGAEAAGLAASCAAAFRPALIAQTTATPASHFVIVLLISIPLKVLRCRFHRYEYGRPAPG